MFAPWCPTCSSRMLLGAGRVEAVEQGPHGPRAILRCHCGTALVWSAEDERAQRADRGDRPSPVAASVGAPSARCSA